MKVSCATAFKRFQTVMATAVLVLLFSPLTGQVIPELGTHTSFNGSDFNIGFQAGIGLDDLDLSLRADFTARAGSKRVLVESAQDPNLSYQYREGRYYLGIEVEKRFRLFEPGEDSEAGIAGAVWGGYTFGDYRGTDVAPQRGFIYRPRVAPYVHIDNVVLIQAGYEYLPLRAGGVSDHRAFISFNFTLTQE